jgi:hypothetical protein
VGLRLERCLDLGMDFSDGPFETLPYSVATCCANALLGGSHFWWRVIPKKGPVIVELKRAFSELVRFALLSYHLCGRIIAPSRQSTLYFEL